MSMRIHYTTDGVVTERGMGRWGDKLTILIGDHEVQSIEIDEGNGSSTPKVIMQSERE